MSWEVTHRMNEERTQLLIRVIQSGALWFAEHWLLVLNSFLALFLIGAYVVAPALLQAGFTRTANIVYTLYGMTCHQLPQRSYFFFGDNGALFATYSHDVVVAAGANPANEWTLRAFRGAPELGYKAAIAERCSSYYFGALLTGLLYAVARRWKKDIASIPLWLLALFVVPMAVDGTSHLISEITRLGFRETNAWAVTLTGGMFSAHFYTGTTVGTLNWLLRTVTGILFGVGIVLFAYPLLGHGFDDVREEAIR